MFSNIVAARSAYQLAGMPQGWSGEGGGGGICFHIYIHKSPPRPLAWYSSHPAARLVNSSENENTCRCMPIKGRAVRDWSVSTQITSFFSKKSHKIFGHLLFVSLHSFINYHTCSTQTLNILKASFKHGILPK